MGYSVMVDAKEPWCCETPCEHRDCAAIRARVNSPCRICKQPVAPGQNYYDESEGGKTVLVHAVCLYDEVEGAVQRSREEADDLHEMGAEYHRLHHQGE